jgi:hypothetical protein
MSESKVTAAHLRRAAVVYVRQSTMAQLSRNRESTTRQYDLVARAVELGWPRAAVRVIDEDLGISAAVPRVGPGSPSWPLRSDSARWESFWRWKFHDWPATTPTGIGCWIWPG